MIAPRLVQLTDGSLAGPPEAQRFRFRVERGGMIGDTMVESGEVIVCGGEPRDGQVTVLVARGPGRPRIGRVQGIRLLGEVGEPCSVERWRPVGRILARYRPQDVSEHAAGGDVSPVQLELFAA